MFSIFNVHTFPQILIDYFFKIFNQILSCSVFWMVTVWSAVWSSRFGRYLVAIWLPFGRLADAHSRDNGDECAFTAESAASESWTLWRPARYR